MSKASPIVQSLNAVLKNELTAVNQYYMHAKLLKHQGFSQLASYMHDESIDEMKHADMLMERILFIGGLPNLQDLGKLSIGEHPEEMLRADLTLEENNVTALKEAMEICREREDVGSEELLIDILASEEKHLDWIRTQLRLIDSIGLSNYLQTQV